MLKIEEPVEWSLVLEYAHLPLGALPPPLVYRPRPVPTEPSGLYSHQRRARHPPPALPVCKPLQLRLGQRVLVAICVLQTLNERTGEAQLVREPGEPERNVENHKNEDEEVDVARVVNTLCQRLNHDLHVLHAVHRLNQPKDARETHHAQSEKIRRGT
jgi:hypothetical protein